MNIEYTAITVYSLWEVKAGVRLRSMNARQQEARDRSHDASVQAQLSGKAARALSSSALFPNEHLAAFKGNEIRLKYGKC